MHVMRARLLLAGALLAAVTPLLPSSADVPSAPRGPRGPGAVVTGRVQPYVSYLSTGLSAGPAVALAQLDRLAADGLDRSMLTAAGAQAFPAEIVSEREPQVFLSAVGDLDGRGGRDVLEQRYSSSGSRDALQLVARDGATGAVLWSRTETFSSAFVVAVPTRVGAAQRPGVVLLSFAFDDGLSSTLTALDGRGRQLWTRTSEATATEGASAPSVGVGSSSSFGYTSVFYAFDRALRRGPQEVLRITEKAASSSANGVRTSQSSSVSYEAVSTVAGASRTLAGGASSGSGIVTGGVVVDQDGDGLDELATVDGGTANNVTLRRASDGKVVWQRTDVATHGFGYVTEAGRLTGGAAGGHAVPDLVLTTAADPGVVGGIETPVLALADPTAGAHGQVLLLRARTGATVWSKPGDSPYVLDRAGVPSLGVVSVTEATTSDAAQVTARLEAFDVAGSSRWSRTVSASAKRSSSDEFSPFVGAFGFPVSDLDADGGLEGVLLIYAFTDSDREVQAHLVRAANGVDLVDQRSGFLLGGVTRHGQDRARVEPTRAGLVVTVLRGRDSATLFRRVVPGSTGVSSGSATAAALGRAVCQDVLVSGTGGGRAVVGVLASDGSPRWTVSRGSKDPRTAPAVRPRTAPRPRC